MANEIAATIVVPTTGDRGLLLPYSIGSIQRQSTSDIEIFVIGDGVDQDTRDVVENMALKDPRIRFFDHPKHERRGEPYRHAALQQARGRIICYLCDRDLMLENHVAVMTRALRDADLAFTHQFNLARDGSVYAEIAMPAVPGPLSMVAHTRSYYNCLPRGWTTTPPDQFTDGYMWQQFKAQPDCRVAQIYVCTIIYMSRGAHPGLSTPERYQEIKRIYERYIEPGADDYAQTVLRDLIEKEFILRRMKSRLQSYFFKLPVGTYMERSIKRKHGLGRPYGSDARR